MTIRDRKDIKRLYYFNNYLPSVIARLYGLSHVRILAIIKEELTIFNTGDECLLCANDDAKPYYIDGNETNNKPQNIIMLCEADQRRISHLQLRRKQRVVKPQF